MTRLDYFHNMSRYGGCEVCRQSALWVLWSGTLPDTFPHLALGKPNWEYGLSLSLPLPLLHSTRGQEALIAPTLWLPKAHFTSVYVFIHRLVECFCFCQCRWAEMEWRHCCHIQDLIMILYCYNRTAIIAQMTKYPAWQIKTTDWCVCLNVSRDMFVCVGPANPDKSTCKSLYPYSVTERLQIIREANVNK